MNELANIEHPARGEIVLRSVAFTFVNEKKSPHERHAYMRASMTYSRFIPSENMIKQVDKGLI